MIAEPKSANRTTKSQHDDTLVAGTAKASIGWIAAVWHGKNLAGVTIGHASPQAALSALQVDSDQPFGDALSGPQQRLLTRLCRHANGQDEDFSDAPIDVTHLGDFAGKVVQRCRAIPRGETMTYGEMAAACGSPKAARAVGNAMASNRFPLVVPCHRVVGSGGGLGGFSAPQGVELKRKLLRREGVEV